MKARIQIPSYYENAIEERISSLEAESRARIHEEVMKERHDIAMRTTYLCLLARYQVGLKPSTLVRIQEAMGPVAKNILITGQINWPMCGRRQLFRTLG